MEGNKFFSMKSNKDMMEKMKKEKTEEKINKIVNNLEKTLESMKSDFCYDCQKIISDILYVNNSNKILDTISNIINKLDLINFNKMNKNYKSRNLLINIYIYLYFVGSICVLPISISSFCIYLVYSLFLKIICLRTNTKIDFYFKPIVDYFQKVKKKYKDDLKKIKKIYESDLKNLKEISNEEIYKLKRKNWQNDFLDFINSINDEKYL